MKKAAKVHQALEKGIREILEAYPNGREYDREELLLDVKHDISLLLKKLNISPKTPVDAFLDEGILVIRLGTFPKLN